eukprot:2728603-Lingulodinium_polyedra.AAC.1
MGARPQDRARNVKARARKTQFIPQSDLQAWRSAMINGPFGPGVVAMGGRYFGAWFASAVRVVFGMARRW